MKKLIVFALISVLVINAFVYNASASQIDQPIATPLWDNLYEMNLSLTFSNNIATATAFVSSKNGCELIEATLSVYQYADGTWIYVDSISNSSEIGLLGISFQFLTNEENTIYQAVFTATAYRDGVGETNTKIKLGFYRVT